MLYRPNIQILNLNSYKANFETELARLSRLSSKIKTATDFHNAKNSENQKLKNIAETISTATKLTREIIDLLIEKVYVYPKNHIEIAWKFSEFIELKTEKV